MDNKPFPFIKILWAFVFFMVPITLLESFLALFNLVTVDFNHVPRNGFMGFIIPILYFPFMAAMLSGLTWAVLNLGNWLHIGFLKLIKKKPTDLNT